MSNAVATILGIILLLMILIQVSLRAKRPIRSAFSSAFLGIFTLCAVNIAGAFTGVILPVSLLSLGVSAVVGIPGVTMLLILNMIF